jgi:hypothetical protein
MRLGISPAKATMGSTYRNRPTPNTSGHSPSLQHHRSYTILFSDQQQYPWANYVSIATYIIFWLSLSCANKFYTRSATHIVKVVGALCNEATSKKRAADKDELKFSRKRSKLHPGVDAGPSEATAYEPHGVFEFLKLPAGQCHL